MEEPQDSYALLVFLKALERIEITESDKSSFERVTNTPPTGEQSFVSHAVSCDVALTPGVWALYAMTIVGTWKQGGAKHAQWLPELRAVAEQDRSEEMRSPADVLWYAVAQSLQILASGPDQYSQAGLILSVTTVADQCESLGDADTAYDLIAGVLMIRLPYGAVRRGVAERALKLAEAAGKSQQIAACTSDVALSLLAMAEADSRSRLDAFDAVERAVELIAKLPQPFVMILAEDLCQRTAPYQWVRPLMLPLLFIVGDEATQTHLGEVIGADSWPQRVSARPMGDWAASFSRLIKAMVWEMEIEEKRLALEPAIEELSAEADWVAWTVSHPGYARSVPHNRSFLREARFHENVLVLTHETTHVLSFLGAVGVSLTALRVATLENELRIATVPDDADKVYRVGGLAALLSADGLAPLTSGDASMLWLVERGLELARKSQMLQDTWTPWFEGLAMFAEGAADPALDPFGITSVTGALRNLVDFHPTPGPSGVFGSQEDIVRQYEEFTATFERACSEAIAKQGPGRLYAYLTNQKIPYFEGYIAVRSVVASWRRTTGRPLTATSCLSLLMHATRFGVGDFIPDLSLRGELFGSEAVAAMVRWARQLAALPKEAIEEFIAPPEKSGPGRPYYWRGGRLLRDEFTDEQRQEHQNQQLRTRIGQAFATLTLPTDVERLPGAGEQSQALIEVFGRLAQESQQKEQRDKTVERHAGFADQLITQGSLFPLGQTKAKFYLNRSQGEERAFFMTQLRTTEDHVDNHKPSVNGFGFPVDFADSEKVAQHYGLRGEPRVSVTRVIDLGGIATKARLQGLHFLAMSYGNWFHLLGPSQGVDKLLREDPDRYEAFADVVQARLVPSAEMSAEQRRIAPGAPAAERARDWIDASADWHIADGSAAVEDWAALVKQLATELLDNEARSRRQRAVGYTLLGGLMGTQNVGHLADVRQRFAESTKKMPAERLSISDSLFRTAQKADNDAWLDDNAGRCEASGFPFFAKSAWGWDVRPSI